MAFFTSNWPWLLVFISVIGICIIQLIKEENANSRWKTWLNIVLMVLGVTGGIGGMVDTYQNKIDQANLKNTIDSTKTIGLSIKRLSELDSVISTQIDSVQRLHVKLDSATQNFTLQGNKLSNQTLLTTRNLNSLSENAKYLVDKIYDAENGGNSIPLVYATTFKDEIIEYSDGGYSVEPFKQSNMYWKFVELENTGDYKLIDVIVTTIKEEYRNRYQKPKELYSQSLLPSQRVRLIEIEMDSLKHEPKEASLEPYDMNYYYTEDNGYGSTLNTIFVSWKNLKYEYYYEIKSGLEITVSDYYFYNKKKYSTKEDLYNAIMEERRQDKLKRMKLPN